MNKFFYFFVTFSSFILNSGASEKSPTAAELLAKIKAQVVTIQESREN